MKPIEFIIAIDINNTCTKVLCKDILKECLLPVKFGEGFDDGIIPTFVENETNGELITNFYDKPKIMIELGYVSAFDQFLQELYSRIIAVLPMLQCYNSAEDANFVVAISYPVGWCKEEGTELLAIVQERIPTALFSIPQEKEILKTESFYENEPSIVGSFNPSYFTYITSLYGESQEIVTHKGLGLNRIELYMLERAISSIENGNTEMLDKDLYELIKSNKMMEAEMFLRRKKYKFIEKTTEKNDKDKENIKDELILSWFEDAKKEFCSDFYNFLAGEKKRIKYKRKFIYNDDDFSLTVYLFGGYSKFLDETIRSVFPDAKIHYEEDMFCVGKWMLDFIEDILSKANAKYEEFKHALLSSHNDSELHKSLSTMVSNAIKTSYSHSDKGVLHKKLYSFVERDYNMTLIDFTNDIKEFINEDLPSLYTDEFYKEICCGYYSVLDSVITDIMKKGNTNNDFLSLNISDYFSFNISSFSYYHGNLKKYLRKPVYSSIFFWLNESDLLKDLYKDSRKVIFQKFIEYLQNTVLVNRLPKISWVILENKYAWIRYFMDAICINEDISITKKKSVSNINFSDLELVINYIFNQFASKYLRQGRITNINIDVKTPLLDKFNFDTYAYIRYIIGEKTIVKPADETIYSLNVEKPKNQILYDKIIDFFNLSQEDINRCKEEKENLSLYDIVEKKYLKYGIE